MSKLTVIGLIITCLFISAFLVNCRHGLKGNGNVTTETRKVSSFTDLNVSGVFKTIISQDGGDEWVKVETDENLQKIVTVSSDENTLSIGMENQSGGINSTRMIVYINVKNIKSISDKSVGAMESKDTLKSDELILKTEAVGKTSLTIDVQKLKAKLKSVGATYLSGKAGDVEIENESVGKLEVFDLMAETLTIKNKSVGAVEIFASKEISIDHSGVGKLSYKGNPAVKALTDKGVGKVSKVD
jgi:hypothetical protein